MSEDQDKPSRQDPTLWVIKCSEKPAKGREGWHWRKYLHQNAVLRDQIHEKWGGPNWIKSHLSRKFIHDRFRKDDLVLCYQKEGREILGFTRLASGGLMVGGAYSAFDLAPSATGYVFKNPLDIDQLRATGCKPEAFTQRFRGTILELSPDEIRGVVAAIIAHSPDEEESFLLWLKSAGFGDGSRPRVKHLGNAEFPFENTTLDIGEIDQKLRALEKKFANNDNVYVAAKVNAIIRRDGPLINALKKKYDYQCQFPSCNTRIQKKNGGYYCEVGHVLAVAKGGVASRINLLVLCPNHHKAVDYGATTVLENTGNWLKIELNGEIVTIKRY